MCNPSFYLPLTQLFNWGIIRRFTVSQPSLSPIFPIQSIVLYPTFNTGDGKGFQLVLFPKPQKLSFHNNLFIKPPDCFLAKYDRHNIKHWGL